MPQKEIYQEKIRYEFFSFQFNTDIWIYEQENQLFTANSYLSYKRIFTTQQDHQNLVIFCKEAFSSLRVFLKVVQYILTKIVPGIRKYAISYED